MILIEEKDTYMINNKKYHNLNYNNYLLLMITFIILTDIGLYPVTNTIYILFIVILLSYIFFYVSY